MSALKAPVKGGDGKQQTAAGKDPPKKNCTVFEPQTWRKTMCKNCFKTREQHTATPADSPAVEAAGGDALPSSSSSPSLDAPASCTNNTAQSDTKPARSTSALNEHSVKEAPTSEKQQQRTTSASPANSAGTIDIKATAKAVGSVKPTVQTSGADSHTGATITGAAITSGSTSASSVSMLNGKDDYGASVGLSENSANNKCADQQQHATSHHIPDRSRSNGVASSSSSDSSSFSNSSVAGGSSSSATVAPVSASTSSLTGQSQGQSYSSSEEDTPRTTAAVSAEEAGEEESYYSRVIAEARKMLEEEEKSHSSSRQRPLVAALPAIPTRPATPRQPPVQAIVQPRSKDDSSTPSRSKDDNDATLNARRIRNARRGSRQEESEWRRAERVRTSDLSRDEAMMEGTRMLIDNLKDKVSCNTEVLYFYHC